MQFFAPEVLAAIRARYERDGPIPGYYYVPGGDEDCTTMCHFLTAAMIEELVGPSPLDAYLAQLGDA